MIANPAAYDAWYETPRGRWIGETEYRLLRRLLDVRPGESLVDAGCGTGYFARRFRDDGHAVFGADLDPAMAAFAGRSLGPATCLAADLTALPFADGSFDCAIAVTSLCFVADERQAVRELLRVARRRIAIGLLNRRSLLWLQKGRRGGSGAYRGARWHDAGEAMALFDGLDATGIQLASAIVLPGGGALARCVERLWPAQLHCGGFLAVSASPEQPGASPLQKKEPQP
jgi:SAM-dependent methyltransferase